MEFSQFGLFVLQTGLIAPLVFLVILLAVKSGWKYGNHVHKRSQGTRTATDETLAGAILGLMALVLAFAFNGAATRLDQREHLIVAEANAIGTAYAAVAYVNPDDQKTLQGLFRDYLDKRIDLYTNVVDAPDFARKQRDIEASLSRLSADSLVAIRKLSPVEQSLANDLVRQLSNMGIAYDNQREAIWLHPPGFIWLSLLALVIVGSFLAGYKAGLAQHKEWFLPTLYALLMSCVIYLILGLEFPLLGHVHLDVLNHEFIRLRDAIPAVAGTSH